MSPSTFGIGDTLKHVSLEQRNFDAAIREFAANLGKLNFLLVAGGEPFQDFYLDGLSRNLSAVLDIGGMRPTLINVSKGLVHPSAYFDAFNAVDPGMGLASQRRQPPRFNRRRMRQTRPPNIRSWPLSLSRHTRLA